MLDPVALMPHAVCWAAAPRLIWTMVVTNAITFLSYLSICLTLLFLVRRTGKVIARDWAYFLVGFALFIVACGSTHLLEVITTWTPIFWVDAWTNVLTAVLSAYVAIMLIRRAGQIGFGVNDYSARLQNVEAERLQLQESLISAQKLEEWSRISAAVSHEIRGPLEAIQNLQFLIQHTEGISPDIAALALTTTEEAARVLAISDSTLSFMRETKRREEIDMALALESVRFLLNPLIREKGLDFQVEISGNCVVEAFPGEIRQILLNIIRNACEAAGGRGSRVLVQVAGEEDGVQVTVSDTGPGIDPEIMRNLFSFGMSTKGNKGNGIGLWTVKHLMDKHHGEVKVDSAVGRGTSFQLWWPAKVEQESGDLLMAGD
ncbi:signal transduction histidine kinase [Granulicella aggregans]|uniref:histidine kinase n=1 Tax=Granulicella aggregans TaxID=474949 RepID=A0A7W7ZAY2_9BACT|nr:HAMP domain-containing sensor histidine kinase [Granulicella aggregans]MBB5056021.1 signal transduction histidine kinase [Granulicella aggregans]